MTGAAARQPLAAAAGTSAGRPVTHQMARRPSLLHNRGFFRLWLTQTASLVGTWLTFVAINVVMLRTTGSATMVALAGIVQMLPTVLVGPFLGGLADRFGGQTLLYSCNLFRAAMLVVLAVSPTPGMILVVAFLAGIGHALFFPALNAVLPRLVGGRDAAVSANTWLSLSQTACSVVGPAVGGLVVVSPGGPAACFALDALSYIAAAVAIATLPRAPAGTQAVGAGMAAPGSAKPGRALPTLRDLWHASDVGLLVGWRFIRRSLPISALLALAAPLLFAEGGVRAVQVVFAQRALGYTAFGYGLFVAVQGLGAFLGGAIARRAALRWRGLRAVALAAVAMSACVLALGVAPGHLAMPLLFGVALSWSAAVVLESAALQRAVPDEVRGRVAGVYGALVWASSMVGMAVTGRVADVAGARAAVATSGVVGGGGAALALGWYWWRTRRSRASNGT